MQITTPLISNDEIFTTCCGFLLIDKLNNRMIRNEVSKKINK